MSSNKVPCIERHKGVYIYKDEHGYYGTHGFSVSFGYADTLAEIRDEIDDHFAGDEYGPLNGYHQGGQ